MKLDKILLTLCVAAGLGYAKSECDDKVFSSLSASKGTTVASMIDQLSAKCSFSVVIKDEKAEEILSKHLNTVNLRDFTLKEILDFLLTENKLDYEYKNGILKIGYYVTKTFKVDYVATVRSVNGNSAIPIGGGNQGQASGSVSGGSTFGGTSDVTVRTEDEFNFWKQIRLDLNSILNPFDETHQYEVNKETNMESGGIPSSSKGVLNEEQSLKKTENIKRNDLVINPQAGLITITKDIQTVKKVEEYINTVMDRIHKQVLIDVQLLNVSLSSAKTTGIDWSQIYNLQNVNINFGTSAMRGIDSWTAGKNMADKIPTIRQLTGGRSWDYIRLDGSIGINDLIKFLKTQGNVRSISNPKLLALNNQPALINSGNKIYYTRQGTVVSGGNNSTTTSNNLIESVFAGISLDITPEIFDDNSILLKINPSITDCLSSSQCQPSISKIPEIKNQPPDLSLKQIFSVVKAKDGDKIILGGLIKNTNDNSETKLPLLGDIPILGGLFGQEKKQENIEELVIVITPHIVKKEKNVSLKDLGYANMSKE